MFVDPVPQRQKVPFEDAVVTRPFPRYPVDAARTGAVDHPCEAMIFRRSKPAPKDGHVNAVIALFGAKNAARNEFQAAARAQRQNMSLDFGCHPMAVDVPIGARMSTKAALLLERHGTPKALRMRPQLKTDAIVGGWGTTSYSMCLRERCF
jgi:hypothetical protein